MAFAASSFQYPLSGRRLCSIAGVTTLSQRVLCFSTLYRVEGCAASVLQILNQRSGPFQYPLSGRRLCSLPASGDDYKPDNVSVPSIGSKAVQHQTANASTYAELVSVPSIGSKAVQPYLLLFFVSLLYDRFQYPLSGRRLCSSDSGRSSTVSTPVSVPSIGSKAVQRPASIRRRQSALRFSTLYRVEGCAAAVPGLRPGHDGLFQYPLSGRRLCSETQWKPRRNPVQRFSTLYRVEGCAAHHPLPPVGVVLVFQYPLSGRRLCSPGSRQLSRIASPSFSTLYRVEGCAASSASTSYESPFCFSTLYRVEGCAADGPVVVRAGVARVSVPSIGSKAVQHLRVQIGRNGRQLFQYPLSGRRLCSVANRAQGGKIEAFQYPLSGRRLCSSNLLSRTRSLERCFSTLYRVEGCAAEEVKRWTALAAKFQYPLSGRRLCSSTFLTGVWTAIVFQYPLSGRRLCSPHSPRSSPAAAAFQYPLSGRRLCSLLHSLRRDFLPLVSVPSIGSKAVQPPLVVCHPPPCPVSVPSIGSKAVQQSSFFSSG